MLKIYFLNSHDPAATVDRSTDKELAGMFNIFSQLTAKKREAIDAEEHTIVLELFWARKFTANSKALLLNKCE